MRDRIRTLLNSEFVWLIRRRFNQIAGPVAKTVAAATAPVRRFLAPADAVWKRVTSPLRRGWAAFAARAPWLAFILGWTGTFVKWGAIALGLLVFGVWLELFGNLPNRAELKRVETANATEVYSEDGLMIGKFYIENRTIIPLDSISPYVVTALLATEDKRFFEHSGIDMRSVLRVFKGIASSQSLGGGSTLSQQLAKNLYPRKNYRVPGLSIIINKIRENFISVRLEQIYNKEELVGFYLNTVPFGGTRYGINVASRYFYNKPPLKLTADQSATLIGMLKASTYYDPLRNPENALKRRNLVLKQMGKNSEFKFDFGTKELELVESLIKKGQVTKEQYEELSKKPLPKRSYGNDDNNTGLATYFREHLRTDAMPKLLKAYPKEDGTPYNLYRDGLKIYTSINSKMQQYAEEAVQKHMQSLQKQFDQHWKNYKKDKPWGDDKWIMEQVERSDRWEALQSGGATKEAALTNFETPVKMTVFSWKNGGSEVDTTLSPIDSVRYYFCLLNCGFMAMEHETGYVRAWVGGTNFKYFKFDHIKSSRQVGSTFKPIVYAAALQDSIRPCQYFPNQVKKIVDWEPHNSDNSYGGWCSVIGGLTNSVNVIAAQLIEKVGIGHTIDLAKQMGVSSTLPREYGISLGAADISLLEMMRVYGTMANQGLRPEPVTVLRIENRKGEVIYDYKEALKKNPELGPHVQALTPDHAAMMTKMLQSVIDYGTGTKIRRGFGLTMDMAGKTGTTQNQSDGWFMCYNPVMVTGAWVGGESPAVRFRAMELGQGSAMALPINAWFWHKIANDRKLGKMVQEKFPPLRGDLMNRFGCPFRLYITPDTFNILMRDSTVRDSMRANGFRNMKKVAEEFFGKPPAGEQPTTPPNDGEEAPKGTKEEEREERRERRKDFFDKLLGKKKDDDGGR